MEYGEVITDGNVSAIIDSVSSNYLAKWIDSAIDNGGYYIGRYELGIDWTTNNYGTREGLVSMRTLAPYSQSADRRVCHRHLRQ